MDDHNYYTIKDVLEANDNMLNARKMLYIHRIYHPNND